MKNKIYLVPGLGAKTDIYKFIRFPGNVDLVPVEWMPPAQNEPLADYAGRLIKKYRIESGQFLCGMSFGGILINEISKIIQPQGMIFISTVKTHKAFPLHFKWGKLLQIEHILPYGLISHPEKTAPYIPFKKLKKRFLLYERYMGISNKDYFKWAVHEILNWQGYPPGYPYIHLHGTHDHIFPYNKLTGKVNAIKNAGHLALMTHPFAISKEIKMFLQNFD